MDYTGMKFGKFTVIEFSHRDHGHSYYVLECECGTRVTYNAMSLRGIKPHGGCEECNKMYNMSKINAGAEKYEYNGQSHTLREWSEITGIPTRLMRVRKAQGKPIEMMLYPGKIPRDKTQLLLAKEVEE